MPSSYPVRSLRRYPLRRLRGFEDLVIVSLIIGSKLKRVPRAILGLDTSGFAIIYRSLEAVKVDIITPNLYRVMIASYSTSIFTILIFLSRSSIIVSYTFFTPARILS